MIRLVGVLALVLAVSVRADAPCTPDIPDDLQLQCIDGVATAVSQSARQYMPFPNWRCYRGQST